MIIKKVEVVILLHRYPKDNEANIFGEYSHIMSIARRDEEDVGCASEMDHYMINGRTGELVKITKESYRNCCENIVSHLSEKIRQ